MNKSSKQQVKERPTIAFRQSLFWDVDPKTIDPEKNAVYVIERILDFGDDAEVRWMWYHYDHNFLREVLKNSRVLSPMSRNFWELMLAECCKKCFPNAVF